MQRHSGAVSKGVDHRAGDLGNRWLLLVYRIPSEPTRLRAGVWRKIKGLGAIYVQNSAAALPSTPSAERALRSLRAEIIELGGSAFLFDSALLAGQASLLELFNSARDDEYDEIVDRCAGFLRQIHKEYEAEHFTYAELEENDVDLAKLKGWLERIKGRDAFGAKGFTSATEAVGGCERALEEYATRVYAEEGDGASSL
ncbi:MAG: ChrB protein [Acidimicrobiaceae bacterium]|nr:ChrB protein [Acidimicrobiaceae bacterium]